ncbi:MAG: TolC family outer membrane protein [Chlorobiales bacterium]|nr:TolC family outer membrane protein [Chlorobiales bacterium]
MKLLMRLIVVACLLFTALPVYAEPFDLSSAYHKAFDYDAQVRAAKADNLVSKEEIAKARAEFRPKISANAQRGRNETYSITPAYYGGYTRNNQFYNSKTYGLSLQQPLFNLSSFADYQQAKAAAAKGDALLENEESHLIVRITEAYCNALYSEDNVELSQTHIKASQEQLQQTKRRFEKGFGTITEISEAQAAYDMALADGVEVVNGLEFSRRELEHFTGVYPNELCKLVPGKMMLEKPVPGNVESWVELARSDNHEIAAARHEMQIAKKEIDRQRAARYPMLNLVAGQNYSLSDNNYIIGSSYNTYSVALQMSMPIYSGGYVSASVRQAHAKRLKAQEQFSWQERGTESDVRKYYNGVVTTIAQIHAYEQAVKSGEIALKGTKKGFELGLRTNMEVLDAEQKLLSNKRNLAKSRYQYILNRLQLKDSSGSLSDSDIDEVNGWLTVAKK